MGYHDSMDLWLSALSFFLAPALGAPLPMPPTAAPDKPAFESLVKPKSAKVVLEDSEALTHAHWQEDDFAFVNAVLLRAPYRLAMERVTDFSLYPRMSSAIKKMSYDEKQRTIELLGEAGGLRMHSWIKVDIPHKDLIIYDFVRGDMTGFKVRCWFWERQGKTLAYAEGKLPRAKTRFPGLVAFAFPTLAELVLSVATKNFRNLIEEDYNQKRLSH